MKEIERSFIYGVSVSGTNFTDREKETRRLKVNFENGLNVILISPRRMGKTSLVKKVQQEVDRKIVPIPTADWTPFIQWKFKEKGLSIDARYVTRICEVVQNQSSYVQQLAWNVMLNTEKEVTDAEFEQGVEDLMIQCNPLFLEQTRALTSFQMNFLRAIIAGQHSGFASQEILEKFQLGSKSNVSKMQKTLIEKDFIELRQDGLYISDPVLQLWLQRQQKV